MPTVRGPKARDFDSFIDFSGAAAGSACWEWIGACDHGYGLLFVPVGHKARKRVRASRTAYERAFGPIPDGLDVCHRCDNPGCVRPEHLFAGTANDNMQDCKAKGRTSRGESRHNVKLSKDSVSEIRRLAAAGTMTQQAIGNLYGVHQATIHKVVSRKHWAHVKGGG